VHVESNDKPVATVGDPALSFAFASALHERRDFLKRSHVPIGRYLDSHMLSWLRNPLTMSSSLCSLDSRERYVCMLLKRRCECQGFQIIFKYGLNHPMFSGEHMYIVHVIDLCKKLCLSFAFLQ
jgi:hypothetical protein